MTTTTAQATGGSIASRIIEASEQWESVAHSMATILGQWIDEGELADIADLKRKASLILDKYESLEDLQS